MHDQELLDFYGTVFGSLQADAEKDRKRIVELTENAEKAVSALSRTAKFFDQSYEKAASQAITAALKKAEANLEAVLEAAKLAQTGYERAARNLTLRLTLAAVFVVMCTAGICFLAIRQAVPSSDELINLIHSSRSVRGCTQKGELQACGFVVNQTTGRAEWAVLVPPPP